MLEGFLVVYVVVLLVGSWLMVSAAMDAPLGYEDRNGFNFGDPSDLSTKRGQEDGSGESPRS